MILNASNAKRYGLAFLAFAALMFCGAVLFAFSSWETYSSRDWPSVPGTMVASYTEHTCGGYRQVNSWEAKILYRYSVGGLLLWAGRMSFRAGGTRYTARIGFRFSYRSKRSESDGARSRGE